jgi:large subunit ribosomal protein L23
MALFSKKDTKKKDEAKAVKAGGSSFPRDLSHVLKHVRITEKASMHSEQGVYTFNVATSVTKRDIKQAVLALYKVTPRLVRVLNVPTKVRRNARTGKTGVTAGGKKAYVYLKKGETLTLA